MLGCGMVFQKCKLIHYIGDNMSTDELINISNELSNKDIVELINMNSDRLFIWNPQDKTCYDLDDEVPASLNGSSVQINLQQEDFKFKPILSK